MLNTNKVSEMLAVTINSITEEDVENNPKMVARLVDNYETILRHIDETIFSQIETNLKQQEILPKAIKDKCDEIDIINYTYTLTSSAEPRLRGAVAIRDSHERDLNLVNGFLSNNKEYVELFNLVNNHVLYFLELITRNTELYFEDLAEGRLDFSSKRLQVIDDVTTLLNKLSQRYNINIER